jgi:hypothetical protein
MRVNEGEPLSGGSAANFSPCVRVDRLARSDGDDLNYSPGDPVDDTEAGDATTPKPGQLLAERLADRGVFEEFIKGGSNLALEIGVEASNQAGHLVRDSQPAHRER